MFENRIIKDVFTEDQIDYLKDMVQSNYHNIQLNADPERGRDDIFLDNNLRDDVRDAILKHFDEGYRIYHVFYSDYNNNHINPNLPQHKDPNYPENTFTFDYKLDANIEWPLCVEGECYSLENNEAITFNPRTQWHYRPELTFKDGDYARILFFYLQKI
jgi:hypothetical protein